MFITKLTYKVVVTGNKAQYPGGAKNFDNYLQNQSQLLIKLLIMKMGFPCISATVSYERDFKKYIKAFTITLSVITKDQFKITYENNDKMSHAFIGSMQEANPTIAIIYNIPYKAESQTIESNVADINEIKVMSEPVATQHKRDYFGNLDASTFEFSSLNAQGMAALTSISTSLSSPSASNSSTVNKPDNFTNVKNDTPSNAVILNNNQPRASVLPDLSSKAIPKQILSFTPMQILQPTHPVSGQEKLHLSLKKFTERVTAVFIALIGRSGKNKLSDIQGLIDTAKKYQIEFELFLNSCGDVSEFVKLTHQKFSDKLKKYEGDFGLRVAIYQNISKNEENLFFLGNFDAQKHIVRFLSPKEKNVFARVCTNFRFFVNSHLNVSEALQPLVKTNQLSFRAALILTKGGFDSFHIVTRNDIIKNPLCVESLLMGHHIPSLFFTKIAHEPYGGVLWAFEYVENIKRLLKSSPRIVELLSTLHPAGNQTIIGHADVLLSELNALNVSIEEFLTNSQAKQAFHAAYTSTFGSAVSKDKWKEILSTSKQKTLTM